ncbi:MAG TPA: maleylpyruvate isomerase family mycothiol-dependent enzyme [Jatrophihabitans sp.]|nr:maleylpyruvate isomerase family mycothiol-dependent enzyme [Jatrophihabitans sp.]
MDVERLLAELLQQGELLDRAAGLADPRAPVPSCPGWTIASAIRHLARVHRRVTAIVRGQDPAAAIEGFRPEPPELTAIYRDGLADLVQALRDAPDDLTADTLWPADSARQFWARRQAHETAIHRVDVELAAGYGVTDFQPDFAVDGLDELVMGMAVGRFSGAGLDGPRTIVLTPVDANEAWTVRLGSSGAVTEREPADNPDLGVYGLASDLYRWAWNRADDSEVSVRGELALADLWHRDFTVQARRS